MKKQKPPAEIYLDHLDSIFQKEPLFFKEDDNENQTNITTIVYKDIPEKGCLTAFTYGLSNFKNPEWKKGRPELCISVQSKNLDWAHVLGYLVERSQGKFPFSYGQTINFREQIADDSKMDAFFIFAPTVLEEKEFLNLDLGLPYKVNIQGIYPIYAKELETIEKIGLEKFWKNPKYDHLNVKRKPIT